MTQVENVRATLLATARAGALVNSNFGLGKTDDAARHVARCIDRTYLPRRIRVTLSNNTEITLDIRSRRLLQFSASSASKLRCSEDFDQETTVCVAKDNAEIKGQLRKLLEGHSVQSQRVVDDPNLTSLTNSGASVGALFPSNDASHRNHARSDLEAFLVDRMENAPVQILGACILNADDILAICGSDEQLLAMTDWARPLMEPVDPNGRCASVGLSPEGTCLLNWGTVNRSQLLISNLEGRTVVVLAEHGKDAGFLYAVGKQLKSRALIG